MGTIDDCESLCETTNLCRGFVYDPVEKKCFLKSLLEAGTNTPAEGFIAKKCKPGVSEIVQGDRDSVIILKEIDKLSEQLDVIVQAICQDEVPNYNCEELLQSHRLLDLRFQNLLAGLRPYRQQLQAQ